METLDGLVKGINLEGVVEGQLVDNVDRLIEFTNDTGEEGEEKEIDVDAIWLFTRDPVLHFRIPFSKTDNPSLSQFKT